MRSAGPYEVGGRRSKAYGIMYLVLIKLHVIRASCRLRNDSKSVSESKLKETSVGQSEPIGIFCLQGSGPSPQVELSRKKGAGVRRNESIGIVKHLKSAVT